MSESGIKYDGGKPMMGLLPAEALVEVAKVLTFGAKKYSKHNWRSGMDWSRLYDAGLRHTFASLAGEELDPESNLDHLAHDICCKLFLLQYKLQGLGNDDRYKQPTVVGEATGDSTDGERPSSNHWGCTAEECKRPGGPVVDGYVCSCRISGG